MDKNKEKAIKKVKEELKKIEKNENSVYFFIIDTKGNPSGSLEYIYNLALIAKNAGYNVGMLHQEDDFVGVRDWLGDEYADLPHMSVASEKIQVSPSDILFIPEIFANVMNQTKKLPCKRVAILQNYDYIVEQLPLSVQWGDMGIIDCIANTPNNKKLLSEIFPYVKTTVITPFINDKFKIGIEPKKMVVNIVARNQEDINRIVKPFYLKYPSFKWVSFKDLRGMSKDTFAQAMRDGAITVWIDDQTSFGYSALEAMKSGSIVIAKIPDTTLEWMEPKPGSNTLPNCCVWFDDIRNSHRQIASVVRSWITDTVPGVIFEDAKEVSSKYTKEQTENEFIAYLKNMVANRKHEIETLLKMEINEEEKENEK